MNFVIVREFPAHDLECAWRDCLALVKSPAHYNSPEYFLVPHFAGKRPFAILAEDGSKVVGVLTGLHEGTQLHCGLMSRPQICIDPTADVHATTDALTRGLLAEGKHADLVSVFAWKDEALPFERFGFRYKEFEGNVVLDLTQSADALFQQFTKDRRRNIRFAEKNGVDVGLATTTAEVAACYDVYVQWRRTQRKKVQGNQTTFEVFAEAAKLTNRIMFIARVGGKPIAINIFRFFPGGLFESASNYSLDAYLHLKPNELLQWRGIEWACSRGLKRHSLGGAHGFLRRFGGTVVPVVRYRLDRSLLRRHDVRDAFLRLSRETVHHMPPALGKSILRVLGRPSH